MYFLEFLPVYGKRVKIYRTGTSLNRSCWVSEDLNYLIRISNKLICGLNGIWPLHAQWCQAFSKPYLKLTGLSHQIRFSYKWYSKIGLVRT
jgi:hypothetical protein